MLPPEPPPSLRLDKWLWQARFCKTRSLAARLVADGKVRVNSQRVTKPATAIRIGDGIVLVLGGQIRAVRVAALGSRRGPATEARGLYLDLDAPAPLEHGAEPDK